MTAEAVLYVIELSKKLKSNGIKRFLHHVDGK
jgi:hypothetical protein